jgi:hypothetical protein
MPDFLNFGDWDWNRIPQGPFNSRLWWLLIALSLALVFTIQAVETAIDGAWPHQHRANRSLPRSRTVQQGWAFVALLVVPGVVLAIGIVAVHIWRAPVSPDQQALGGVLVGVGWLLFLLFGLNMFRLGSLMTNLGMIGPIAIMILLIVGNLLLLTAFMDILPSLDVVRSSVENGLRDLLPFTS